MDEATNEKWLTPAEAARYLRLSVKTLERYRQEGTGPRYARTSSGRGGRILYSLRELDRFLAERTFCSTSEY